MKKKKTVREERDGLFARLKEVQQHHDNQQKQIVETQKFTSLLKQKITRSN